MWPGTAIDLPRAVNYKPCFFSPQSPLIVVAEVILTIIVITKAGPATLVQVWELSTVAHHKRSSPDKDPGHP